MASMFCNQCQEAAGGNACTQVGVCGKTPEVSNLQNLLIYTLKGLSLLSQEARKKNLTNRESDIFLIKNLFSTLTNVNFHQNYFLEQIEKTFQFQDHLKQKLEKFPQHDAINWRPETKVDYHSKAQEIMGRQEDEDMASLKELLTYGIKGIAAYLDHAVILGYDDDIIIAFIEDGLAATLDENLNADDLLSLVMKCGEYGVKVMSLLDQAHRETYGDPGITKVATGVRENPGILISGHDLKDMEQLLEQTQNTGIDVYTHGEMLPAHYYPAFKKYQHLVGNYGGAWPQQKKEFEKFNGPILINTNCLVPPADSYKNRLYTTNVVGFPNIQHIPENSDGSKDFSKIIAQARESSPPQELDNNQITGGFAHNQVMALADKVIQAIKDGDISRFVVMAGCDGRHKNRQYYQELAQKLPQDTVILTAGCAKYRYNKLPLGQIGDIPRVLDAGQCNDSYSLAYIALKLKEVLGLEDINELPISYNIAWYEQKAVTVLLALLYLGVKDIKLGPSLPPFLSPGVGKILAEKFAITIPDNVDKDLLELS